MLLFEVLANDYDSNSDALAIKDVSNGTITPDNKILYKSLPTTLLKDSLQYRVMEASNPNSWSEWTTVYIDLSTNPDLPVAVPDYATTKAGVPVNIFPLTNDDWKEYDSLRISIVGTGLANKGTASFSGDTVTYTPAFQAQGVDSVRYFIRTGISAPLALGTIYVNITKQYYYDSLNVNNINAGINASNFLFCNHWEIKDYPSLSAFEYYPHFKTPANQQASTIFSNTFWVGGIDQENNLHFASEMYQQNFGYGFDWQSGPVSSVYDSDYRSNSARLWKISKAEIEFHRQNYNQTGYVPVEAISSWPGNGNTENGQAAQLAPYYDLNNDGLYNCLDGDYPLIRGDQTIYYIFNDDTPRINALPLKLEVHGMVYGFDAPQDTALNNTVFVHYDLINRSGETYTNCFAGLFTDLEIGNAQDDYLRCDVNRGSFYAYNGDEDDEFAPQFEQPEIATYGDNPPAQSVTVLAGPFMDSDGIDNPAGGCNESVNGLNFGNQVADDERSGLARFMYYQTFYNPMPEPQLFPVNAYNYLQGMWLDSTLIMYGGNSHPSLNSVGPACRYMFPGDSDPLNYGTNCEFPNAGYNQGDKFWTEEEAGNEPGDRRGLGTLGPFTLTPGQVQEIDLAYVVGHGTNGVNLSVNQLLRNIDSLRNKLASGNLLIPNELLGFAPKTTNQPLLIYPNPANEVISITGLNSQSKAEYSIYNLFGTCLAKGILQSGNQPKININMLPAGMYLVKVSNGKEVSVGKFVKR